MKPTPPCAIGLGHRGLEVACGLDEGVTWWRDAEVVENALEETGWRLGREAGSLVNLFDPAEPVVFGGGLYHRLLAWMEESLRE
ncbi:MAG: ROK family protein [Nitriliruptor sp.]|nr:MAG: ROK family protein [Nitriliruptor sp.]